MGQTQNIEQQIQLLSNLQLGFGIAAPQAAQRTAFEEYRGPYSRSVVYRHPLYVKNCSGLHFPSPSSSLAAAASAYVPVFSPSDDVVLYFLVQLDEVCRISCNSYQQVLVFLWMFLSVFQCRSVDYVDLDMFAVHLEV